MVERYQVGGAKAEEALQVVQGGRAGGPQGSQLAGDTAEANEFHCGHDASVDDEGARDILKTNDFRLKAPFRDPTRRV